MAFMTAPSTTGGGDRLPILKFDARAGRLFTIDRTQAPDGSWLSQQTDITMAQPLFCVDFGTLEVGWAHFAAGGPPQWALAFYGQPQPARPASPGQDDQNRAQQFKSAFRVKVAGQGIGGVREFGGNSGALITGMNDLHTRFEASPEAAAGRIPVVRMSATTAIKSGQSTNYMPVFEIVAWVDRPPVLGERMVAIPGRAQFTTPVPASVPVPPPAPRPVVQQHVQTAPQAIAATAYAPQAPIAQPVPPARATVLVDDDLPF